MPFNIAIKRSHILCVVSVWEMISVIRKKIFMSLGSKTFFPNSSNGRFFFPSVTPGSSFTLVLFHGSPTVTVTAPSLSPGLGSVVCGSRRGKETVQPVKRLSSPGHELLRCCDRGITVASSPWGAGGAGETSR